MNAVRRTFSLRPVVLGFATLAVLGLAACAPDFNPPPDYQGGFLADSDKSRTIKVQAGDSVYDIAHRYDVPTKVIVARNGLKPPYALTAGQDLILDPAKMHRVVQGDSLRAIGRTYGVDFTVIAEANDLRPPYTLRAGQELWIPDPFTAAAARSASSLPPEVVNAEPGQAPQTSEHHAPGVIVENLAPPPGSNAFPEGVVQTPAPIETAQGAPSQPVASTPSLPAVVQAPAASAPVAAAPSVVVPSAAAPSPVPAPAPQVAAPMAEPAPVPAPDVAAPAAEVALPAATAHFIWPVKGRLLSGFGPAGQGLHNDGINIAAPAGAQVRAVDNGRVVYAGSELKGFGNLLLVQHSNGLTTAYAHNAKLLVSRGDTVKQGQVIATVGKTGGVTAPQLHFEVRQGTQAVDPQIYLPQTAH